MQHIYNFHESVHLRFIAIDNDLAQHKEGSYLQYLSAVQSCHVEHAAFEWWTKLDVLAEDEWWASSSHYQNCKRTDTDHSRLACF